MSAKRDDRGETFVELLVTVTVLGIAVVGVLGALMISLSSSYEHRSLANIDTVLRSYAETIKYDVELQPSPWYQDCATVASSSDNGNAIAAPPAPTGWSRPYVVGIQYLNNTSGVMDNPCQAGDSQLITVGLRAADG